jgi:hypothetical protein
MLDFRGQRHEVFAPQVAHALTERCRDEDKDAGHDGSNTVPGQGESTEHDEQHRRRGRQVGARIKLDG